MNLLLTLDENYLLPFKVMLDSFFASNPQERDVTVYLLHSAIPGGKLSELDAFCAGFGAKLIPVAVEPTLFENAPTSKRYPKEMYYRLLSPLILPRQVERVLYLDPDMLIMGNWSQGGAFKDSEQQLQEMYENPAYSSMRAIRDKQVVILPQRNVNCLSHHVTEGIETVYQAVYEGKGGAS